MIWKNSRRLLDLTHRGAIMGVLNVTPDSFSDGGGTVSRQAAVTRGLEMLAEGAEILDIGGESTRPGAQPVPLHEELQRVVPVLQELRLRAPDAILSIDTMKSAVADAALTAGADIWNDVTALRGDPDSAAVAARHRCGVCLMHMQGKPPTMQQAPHYQDVAAEVRDSLAASLARAVAAGIDLECVALDPGIGFGKTREHNLTLLRDLPRLALGGRPLLVGVSRKSFLGGSPEERLWPTVALTAYLRESGARIFRVHDVRENLQALRMMEAILHSSPYAQHP